MITKILNSSSSVGRSDHSPLPVHHQLMSRAGRGRAGRTRGRAATPTHRTRSLYYFMQMRVPSNFEICPNRLFSVKFNWSLSLASRVMKGA